MQKKNSLLSLVLRFLKIGCIGFGGGTALIPIISKETVGIHKKITQEEVEKQVIVASITPGALPVEVACGIGKSVFGKTGMILAAVAMALPGVLMTILFLSFLSVADEGILKVISYLAVAVNVFILVVIFQYVVASIKKIRNNRRVLAILMVIGVFMLNGGKNISPIFGISTIEILCIAFFVLCFTEGNIWTFRTIFAVLISFAFLLALGEVGIFANPLLQIAVKILMVVLSLIGLGHSVYKNRVKKTYHMPVGKRYMKEVIAWILFLAVISLPSFFLVKQAGEFLLNGFFSAIISFGGGDAYLTVADALFVQNGWIPEDIFYQQIIPVVNSSPGSVLCETLSAVGYEIGFLETGSIWGGYAVSLAGFGVSVMASCLVFVTVQRIYDRFESLHIFQMLRYWMGTIIAGLLLSVGYSLVMSNLRVLGFGG